MRISKYSKGNYLEMAAGSKVFDTSLCSIWNVISNDGQKVTLQNTAGGSKGAKINVTDGTCSMTFFDAKTVEGKDVIATRLITKDEADAFHKLAADADRILRISDPWWTASAGAHNG